MGRLCSLPNIALKLEEQLNSVGIETPEQLASAGSEEVLLRIKAIDSSACYNRLCALKGQYRGLNGIIYLGRKNWI
jgi:DNA transformation protein